MHYSLELEVIYNCRNTITKVLLNLDLLLKISYLFILYVFIGLWHSVRQVL